MSTHFIQLFFSVKILVPQARLDNEIINFIKLQAGFKDGASDGQTAIFQSSFNIGYIQGLDFGIHLGIREAIYGNQEFLPISNQLSDPRKINCQLCINKNIEEKIDNLFNTQEETNNIFLLRSVQ
ncbi:unnamed protein product [Diatraea saccharalis]|uniref:Essential protein Yae1 N-terminal domain-containing protein n=1 Tax=Diatraea saccharalis TaxID=40085 RepID=A0A9N9R4S5_9NEOP|nr:unnamed protein product [Diatraea saccharalis]